MSLEKRSRKVSEAMKELLKKNEEKSGKSIEEMKKVEQGWKIKKVGST